MKSDHETRMHVAASTKNRRNSRGNGFRFIFFFAFRVYFPRSVFHFSTLPLSVSLQSSTLNPHPSLFSHPCFGFYPHPVHAGAFTFDESRWNYPLHSRSQWSSSLCGVKRQREWGREGGVGGETVNHPVDICARITRKAGDSFEAILFPTSAPLLYYYSSSSRDSMSRGKKKVLKAATKYDALRFKL